MEGKWLNFFLKYSAFTFRLKQKIIQNQNWVHAIPSATLLILSELGFAIVSIPLYLLVPPKIYKKEGLLSLQKKKKKFQCMYMWCVEELVL